MGRTSDSHLPLILYCKTFSSFHRYGTQKLSWPFLHLTLMGGCIKPVPTTRCELRRPQTGHFHVTRANHFGCPISRSYSPLKTAASIGSISNPFDCQFCKLIERVVAKLSGTLRSTLDRQRSDNLLCRTPIDRNDSYGALKFQHSIKSV